MTVRLRLARLERNAAERSASDDLAFWLSRHPEQVGRAKAAVAQFAGTEPIDNAIPDFESIEHLIEWVRTGRQADNREMKPPTAAAHIPPR